jgi:isopentenyl-diphosphate delta-isomerase
MQNLHFAFCILHLCFMELIDVLTPDGERTGIRKPKPLIHRDGDWHRAAHIWIATNDGRILLQRRSLQKENHPGLWDVSAAGHVSSGESVIDSAVREAEEELGLRIDPSELRHIATIAESCVLNDATYFDNEFHEIFLVRRDVDLARLKLQREEVDAVELVTPDQLRARLHEMVPHGEEYNRLLAAIE